VCAICRLFVHRRDHGEDVEIHRLKRRPYYVNSDRSFRAAWATISLTTRCAAAARRKTVLVVYDGARSGTYACGPASEAALTEQVRAIVSNLDGGGLPRRNLYRPVLFEPKHRRRFSAKLSCAPFSVVRRPVAERDGRFSFGGSDFETRLGSRVLPRVDGLTDDPTLRFRKGRRSPDVKGRRRVTPSTAEVVEKGILRPCSPRGQPVRVSLLPRERALLPGAFGLRQPRISNLMVKRRFPNRSRAEDTMIEMMKQQGKAYASSSRKWTSLAGFVDDLRRLSSGRQVPERASR